MKTKSVRVTGFAVINGVLHVYSDPEELRSVIISKKFDHVHWLDKMVLHEVSTMKIEDMVKGSVYYVDEGAGTMPYKAEVVHGPYRKDDGWGVLVHDQCSDKEFEIWIADVNYGYSFYFEER